MLVPRQPVAVPETQRPYMEEAAVAPWQLVAMEAIKLITGAGAPLSGRLMLYDGLAGGSRVVKVAADPACPICGSAHA